MSIRDTFFNYPVYIRSADRLTGTESNFRLKVNASRSFKNVLVCVKDAIVPASWYNVNSSNNQFSLTEEDTGGGNPQTIAITIPPGNYTTGASSFPAVLKTLLDTNSPNTLTYTVAYDSVEGHFTISETNASYEFKLVFSGDSQANVLLGFDEDTTTALGSSLESDNVIDISGTKSLSIKMNIAYDSSYETAQNQPSNIVQKIPVGVNSYGIVQFTNLEIENSRIIATAPLDSILQVQLLDDQGNEIDLNGLDWEMTLLVQKERSRV